MSTGPLVTAASSVDVDDEKTIGLSRPRRFDDREGNLDVRAGGTRQDQSVALSGGEPLLVPRPDEATAAEREQRHGDVVTSDLDGRESVGPRSRQDQIGTRRCDRGVIAARAKE